MNLENPQMYAGEKMLMRRDFMKVEQAMPPKDSKWNLIECLIGESIPNALKVDMKDSPLLISEDNLHDCEFRRKMAEILFEKFQVPYLYSVKKAALAS